MRVTSTVVVLSSLLIASAVLAQPKTPTPAPKTGSGSAPATGSGSAPAPAPMPTPEPSPDPSTVKPEDMPTAVRMRRLEQQTQALKEKAWQLKARVQMLKEQMLGGGVGAQAVIAHSNEMGSSFRLIKITYTLDGTTVLQRNDDAAEDLYKTKSFDVFAGPIAPGNHTLTAVATYRGHGYGVFAYLSKYTFTARGNQSFSAGEGKTTKVDCRAYEKGGSTTPLEKRPALECKVGQVSPDKAPDAPTPNPGTPSAPTPAASTPATPAPGK
ncbi:MAG: dihydrolipoamide acetyltransferase [Myxococcota bacterium]|nr:dihydrolipoamide acetyltransferase [Myxococcota bacterium]